ncbi:MAG: ABC transporter ATP-binding protein [Nocardioides sp.]|uniref:ABC transporter ATP-binding protein n=1 Tax=Nocardioides sp. TaxID=35761 RepID=UPI0039E4578D
MLRLERVGVAFDGVAAAADVTLGLADGEVLALLGPSGSGKSTLLRAVAGLESSTGTISWDGRSLAGVPTHRRGFALMFQDGQLFPQLTVAGNVGYALRLRHTPAAKRRARVAELLALVGLSGYEDRLPRTLSGGERQRVALARALAVEPRLLLLDEPLSALDASLRERLAGDLRRILVESGTTALLVTHDHEEAFAVADRLAVMRDGRIVQSGDLAEVWRHPVDPWTALFLGYARVYEGDAAALLRATESVVGTAESVVRTTESVVGAAESVVGTGRVVGSGGADPDGPDGTATGAVACRRSALVLDPEGPLAAEVLSARTTPDQVRLVVRVDGLGAADAVAVRAPAPGERIRLRVEPSRIAVLG